MASSPTERAQPEYLTPEECAQLLKVRPAWVFRRWQEGRFPPGRKIGKYLRIDRGQLLTWIESGGNGSR